MKWLYLAALVTLGTPTQEAACFRACVDCSVRCKRASDPEGCRHTCLELKAQCCRSCGSTAGPRKTCSCGWLGHRLWRSRVWHLGRGPHRLRDCGRQGLVR